MCNGDHVASFVSNGEGGCILAFSIVLPGITMTIVLSLGRVKLFRKRLCIILACNAGYRHINKAGIASILGSISPKDVYKRQIVHSIITIWLSFVKSSR